MTTPESQETAEQLPAESSASTDLYLDPNHPIARIQHPKQRAFIEAYCRLGTVGKARKATKLHYAQHYKWLQADPLYREAFEWAKMVVNGQIEDEIYRRGVQGWLEPVYYQGEVCGRVRRYSDGLLTFLAKARMPEKYGQRVAVTGHDGGPIKHAHLVASLPPEAIKKLADLLDDAQPQRTDGTVVIDLDELESSQQPKPQPDSSQQSD